MMCATAWRFFSDTNQGLFEQYLDDRDLPYRSPPGTHTVELLAHDADAETCAADLGADQV